MHKLVIFFLFFTVAACAQEYVYVNTANLLLRDRPEKEYNVFDVLYAPCRLEVLPYGSSYKSNASITKRFYYVLLSVPGPEPKSMYNAWGWVEKRYVVSSREKVTVKYPDSVKIASFTIAKVSRDPRLFNYRSYPYPAYKGGEKTFPAPFRPKYQKGPRGGCYYINQKGRKVYVDAKCCK